MQTTSEKTRENLVRRQLARRGYRLERSRQRDPGGADVRQVSDRGRAEQRDCRGV